MPSNPWADRTIDGVIAIADRLAPGNGRGRSAARPDTDVVGNHTVTRLGNPVAAHSSTRPLALGLHGFASTEEQPASLVPLERSRQHLDYLSVRGEWSVAGGGYAWFPFHNDDADHPDLGELGGAVDRLAETVEQLTGPQPARSGSSAIRRERWLRSTYSRGIPV